MSEEPDYEFVEGATSDVSFVAWGETREEVFAAAAEALLAATVEEPALVGGDVARHLVRHVVLEEEDPELLLLRFLNELVYLRDAEGLLLRAREVRLSHATGGHRLEVDLVGERWSPERHESTVEVKAATAHGLALRKAKDRWEASVTLDV